MRNFFKKLTRKNLKRKKNFFFSLKKKKRKNISRNFSGAVAVSVGSV